MHAAEAQFILRGCKPSVGDASRSCYGDGTTHVQALCVRYSKYKRIRCCSTEAQPELSLHTQECATACVVPSTSKIYMLQLRVPIRCYGCVPQLGATVACPISVLRLRCLFRCYSGVPQNRCFGSMHQFGAKVSCPISVLLFHAPVWCYGSVHPAGSF